MWLHKLVIINIHITTYILIAFCLVKSTFGGCPANSKSVLRDDQKLCIELYKVCLQKTLHLNMQLNLFQEPVNWYVAKRKCISKGQNILEIKNKEEYNSICRLFPTPENDWESTTWIGGENHADLVSFIIMSRRCFFY